MIELTQAQVELRDRRYAIAHYLRSVADLIEGGAILKLGIEWDGGEKIDVKFLPQQPAESIMVILNHEKNAEPVVTALNAAIDAHDKMATP